MSADPKKFYLTTPIYYVNARPHIGHAYTTIVADVLARRHRLLGDETFFLTGTDEHGQKIERSAAAAGVPPQQFTDQVAAEFKTLWDRMGITYDKFIRTTDPAHKLGVQQLWRALESRRFIYLDTYTGSYCVSDEAFVDAPAGTPCPDCGRLLETVTEENYFFELSKFQLPLLNLIESGKLNIENEARRNEVLSFLRGPLSVLDRDGSVTVQRRIPKSGSSKNLSEALDKVELLTFTETSKTEAGTDYIPFALNDLSISRSSFKWGIPVPGNENHVVYVWLDALINYITALGYGSDDTANFEKFWPADLQLVGKEIIRFHCVYWPAFLLAAGLPIPKAITAHGWLLFDNSKMSKSKGNIVRTETILDALGTLCPPAPLAPAPEAVILSEAKDLLSSDAPQEPTKSDRDLFASDILRYFLLREIPFGQDGSFSFDALLTRYNADLANGYGNLVSRTLSMIAKYNNSEILSEDRSKWTEKDWVDHAFGKSPGVTAWSLPDQPFDPGTLRQNTMYHAIHHSLRTRDLLDNKYGDIGFQARLAEISLTISVVDGFLSGEAPWKLAKLPESKEWLQEVLYTSVESIRMITVFLYPFLPYATSRVWAQLGLGDIELAAKNGELKNLQWGGLAPGTKLGPLSPIFPRADKSLIETMINMEEQNARPETPLKSATTPTHAAAEPTDSTHPAAGPRPIHEPSDILPVGGSTALTTGPDPVPPPAPLTPNTQDLTPASISIDDFAKIELRVAQIVVAERIPKADKLLRLEVDLGPDFPKRQILSGIAEHYTPEELIGRRIVVITNLAPRKMRGLESHGMLLAASDGENGKPILATFAEDIALGSRLK